MWKFQRQSVFCSNETLKCDEVTTAISCECFPFFFLTVDCDAGQCLPLSTQTPVWPSNKHQQTDISALPSDAEPRVDFSFLFLYRLSPGAVDGENSSEKPHLGTDKTTSLMTSLAFIPVCSTDSKQNITQE